ncbi:MAG: rRNA maturation RNase YbeY [Clostridia bacterium]|nr:rRNA maturation RNase YbeY [Clostridia bacterium]MBQ2433226.1 rRNA maturation RNase YbeY [Clostridia bacterium]MBQ5771390.1 rRNA maturation RNase YbeY [Clostridia bacterium]
MTENMHQSLCLIEQMDDKALAPDGFWALCGEVANACLEIEGVKNAYVSISLVTGEEIKTINRETRSVDKETDVLSFPNINYAPGKTAKDSEKRLKKAYDPAYGRIFLGDIVLNTHRAMEQARQFGHSFKRELGYLTAHAMFHLMGYDHMTDDEKAVMREMEKKAMRKIQLYRKEESPVTDEMLKSLAIEALDYSYSPYSRFRVGACLLSEDGRTFKGANFENASYGATICAERCAVSNALMAGARKFTKIAITTDEGYAWPCGICRQVLNEFKDGDMVIMVGGKNTPWKTKMLSELLPESFGPEDLDVQEV